MESILPPLEAIRPELEAEIRQHFIRRSPEDPSALLAAYVPRINPAVIDLILQELPSIYAIIRRIVDSSKSGS